MNTVTYIINELADWDLLVRYILRNYPDKRIFLLTGNLGAGKTTFVQAFGSVLEVKEHITSPTFSIMHEYHTYQDVIYHFDLYRLNTLNELKEIGFEDYLFSDKYCFIEWPELAQAIFDEYPELNNKVLNLQIHLSESGQREVNLILLQ